MRWTDRHTHTMMWILNVNNESNNCCIRCTTKPNTRSYLTFVSRSTGMIFSSNSPFFFSKCFHTSKMTATNAFPFYWCSSSDERYFKHPHVMLPFPFGVAVVYDEVVCIFSEWLILCTHDFISTYILIFIVRSVSLSLFSRSLSCILIGDHIPSSIASSCIYIVEVENMYLESYTRNIDRNDQIGCTLVSIFIFSTANQSHGWYR